MTDDLKANEPGSPTHAGDPENMALLKQVESLRDRIADLHRRRDRHDSRKPTEPTSTRAQRRELERWQQKSVDLGAELERDRTEYVQLLERQKDWHRRHHESRVEIVEFTCGKCGAPHRVGSRHRMRGNPRLATTRLDIAPPRECPQVAQRVGRSLFETGWRIFCPVKGVFSCPDLPFARVQLGLRGGFPASGVGSPG